MKFFVFYLAVASFLFFRREHFNYVPKQHYPGEAIRPFTPDHCNSSCYMVGSFIDKTQQFSVYERLFRKRINNYVFALGNQHKVQMTLIDLGYASVVNTNFFSQQLTHSLEQMTSFSLHEDPHQQPSIHLNSSAFRLHYSVSGNNQLRNTQLLAAVTQGDSRIEVNLNYQQNQKRCVSYLRKGVVNFKCYAGIVSGTVAVELRTAENSWLNKTYYLSGENSSAALDVFRASGWEWKWVWGMGSGLIKDGEQPINFGINLGSIEGIGQDVIHLNSTVIPLPGLRYVLNENSTAGSVVTFTSQEEPSLELNFSVTVKEHKYKDMVVLKNDMVKFQGYWNGWLNDPNTDRHYSVTRVPGLLEAASSLF